MNIVVGNGGILTEIYEKYKTLENHVSITSTGAHYDPDFPNKYFVENILNWNDKNGFHSIMTNEEKQHILQFNFKKPFYLKSYRPLLNNYYRFVSKIIVKTSLRNSPFTPVYYQNEKLCDKLSSKNECAERTEKYFRIPNENISLCDKVQFVSNGPDTRGTYSLSFNGLELYGDYKKGITCKKARHSFDKSILIMIIIHIS